MVPFPILGLFWIFIYFLGRKENTQRLIYVSDSDARAKSRNPRFYSNKQFVNETLYQHYFELLQLYRYELITPKTIALAEAERILEMKTKKGNQQISTKDIQAAAAFMIDRYLYFHCLN
jgi:hypothetical protein